MKRTLFILLLLGLTLPSFAQEGSMYLSSQRQPIRVSVNALYQTYERDSLQVSEVSVPVSILVPIGQKVAFSLQAGQASATGDNLESLSGVSDVQAGLSFLQKIGSSSLVLSLGANLPSGKRELTEQEFQTSLLLSQHFYDFRIPGFGQGFNVAPGFVWAFPMSETVVLGLGASYQYKGAYRPLAEMPEDYDPGDEIIITGGLDIKAAPTTNLSADVTYTTYTSDKLGEEEVFAVGDRLVATGQVLTYFGVNELRVVGRYRGQSESSLPAGAGGTDEALRTLPAQGLIRLAYRQALGNMVWVGLLGQARLYDETSLFEKASLFDAGLLPEVAVSPSVRLQSRFIYTFGDFSGFEVGGGLVLSL
ncbi:MAG TPA: hypothetical protein VKP65_13615 [Rhodothermales bacterium]|nr:hypothetical protein [Rhodothermales bacterium]